MTVSLRCGCAFFLEKLAIIKCRLSLPESVARQHGDYTEKYTEVHHVFFGSGRRNISEQNGFTCSLCLAHHREGPEAVHGKTRKYREYLCRIFQKEYERTHTREEFMELIGKDYLKGNGKQCLDE